jgi:mycoredoxin
MSEVVMYGADWCGDCRRSKKVFERLAVTYRWVDCDATPGAIEKVVEINGGMKSIPVIVFPDGSHLTEPSDEALEGRLAALGLVPPPR